ncbi:hypothetical protein G8O24_17430 [Bradyrhizobium sp. INPA01-394B]|uniref:Uncharacterized protein n=1 Tax=Bradyrhizobium campsiandrae TaxID=1729892 RepID=A0ABR7UHK6_9BRAD|nr:hypothetical protein [Bradyrhizobium campsiandrae]MBC9879125.1 hypothetical protein [Bradyrhizobium campsiandrae]MBC9983071.1 hypothetical protein [Bradyrhizobium campsiandrae]
MERDQILRFPCPDHGLSSQECASEVTRLADQLESALAGGEEGYAQQLARIERASLLLNDMSRLVSRGRDRQRATEAFEQIMRSLAELRSKL